MGRIEKTVFISYRRTNLPWALCIYQNLTQNGYDVFFDYQSIDSGSFETAILDNIRARAHFVLILTPSALERCKNPNDWLRREIETAIDEKRNIVPLMLEGFDFGSPHIQEVLTGKLSTISTINALPVHSAYVFEALERLRTRFLNVALEDVNLPLLSEEAQEVTKAEQDAANEAEPVSEEQLTAQTWFERGYLSDNVEELIRCMNEAIRLDPKLINAYIGRGLAYNVQNKYSEALIDFNKAINDMNTDDKFAFKGRGSTRLHLNDLDGSIQDFNKAIILNANYATAYLSRGLAWEMKKEYQLSILDYEKYLELGGGIRNGDQKEVEEIIKKLKKKLNKKKSVKKTKKK